ncbi:hypothetical protein EJB05_04933 [Eragrostis curvula]|uniref:Uncharacterized protein n=1 Tax=Eragrostis curvula TaxID=38414 RepID=A0A5J9WBT2_9POAL|nr:hypothetical protein EJB05_04933 [Eragrostis curvula]
MMLRSHYNAINRHCVSAAAIICKRSSKDNSGPSLYSLAIEFLDKLRCYDLQDMLVKQWKGPFVYNSSSTDIYPRC